MTTIAYSFAHRQIAADRQATLQGNRIGEVTKIRRIGPLLLAGAGSASFIHRFMAWVTAGMEGECPPMSNGLGSDASNAVGLIYWGDICIGFNEVGADLARAPYFANGSGGEMARGVLALGASPEEAVRAAMKHDIYTGGGVDVLTIPESEQRFPVEPQNFLRWKRS